MSGVQWFKRKDPTLFDSIIISSYEVFKHENADISVLLEYMPMAEPSWWPSQSRKLKIQGWPWHEL